MDCIIVAFTHSKFAIGSNGKLPWPHLKADMQRFKELTSEHNQLIVMGRVTADSIGGPLRNRDSFIVCGADTDDDLEIHLHNKYASYQKCYIGGERIYEYALKDHRVGTVYATVIEKEFPDQDRFFPVQHMAGFKLSTWSARMYDEASGIHFRFVKWIRDFKAIPSLEQPYMDLLRNVVQNGEDRPDRTGVGTYGLFGGQMRFNLSQMAVPFVTTKRLAWKSVLKELLWMLRGETDSKILEAQGVNIWKGNTTREFLDARGLHGYPEGETGPLYGASLRRFRDGRVDQLTRLVDGIKQDPYSRRHVMTTFDPSVVDECVLMPCHGICIQFHCHAYSNGLSCHVYCRSSDLFLGLPFNIASYAILLRIIAAKTDRQPADLIVSLGDAHVYKNHYDAVLAQLERTPLPSPVLNMNASIKDKAWEEIAVDDFELIGYIHHPVINAEMAV